MSKTLQNTLADTQPIVHSEAWTKTTFQVILGSILLGVLSQISIPLPFTPIPMTLQTLAIYLLALTLGSKKGFLSVLLYLIQASFSLPVLARGNINPLWFTGPTAGYLIGFAVAVYCIGYLLEKKPGSGLLWTLFSILVGQTIILSFGTLRLGTFVGFDKAFVLGALPFLYGDAVKICIAITTTRIRGAITNL